MFRHRIWIIAVVGLFLVSGALIGVISSENTSRFERMMQAKALESRGDIRDLAAALARFHSDVGRYPTHTEGLNALVAAPPNAVGWRGPYVRRGLLTDPWGHPYLYRSPGKH